MPNTLLHSWRTSNTHVVSGILEKITRKDKKAKEPSALSEKSDPAIGGFGDGQLRVCGRNESGESGDVCAE